MQVVVLSHQAGTVNNVIQRHPLNAAVAAELSGYLKAAGMTQAQLADACDMNPVVVQRYLAGARDITVAHIARFALVLSFEPVELFIRARRRLEQLPTTAGTKSQDQPLPDPQQMRSLKPSTPSLK